MSTFAIGSSFRGLDRDRIGIALSVLCAIHCAATPILLLAAPAFGQVWSHPASHWLVALAVIPLAGVSIAQGFSRHQRKWIPICGVSGMVLILVGAALPYLERTAVALEPEVAPLNLVVEPQETEFVFVVGRDDLTSLDLETEASCTDNCCPSLLTDENGETQLHIPPASIVTTLGGLILILTHAGNICSCTVCGSSGRNDPVDS